jgi:hypothetical protein
MYALPGFAFRRREDRPMRIARLLALLIGTLALPALLHAQQYTPLQQRMSAAEFKAAGLDKLSPAELHNLDAWLRTHGKVQTRIVDASGAPVFYPDESKRNTIFDHIVGPFGGWTGHNQLTLDNGQQWKQVGSDDISCQSSNHPEVKIKPSLFGNWLAYVHGCNGSAHVKRVR